MLTLATLSVHNFVNSVGAYVGLASIVAVAILILLYFAHARETATLRERLDDAQARIGGLEARLAQILNAQAGAQAAAQRGRVPGQVAPVPVVPPPIRPTGSAVASVRRVPSTAAGAAAAAAVAPSASALLPAAPAGVAGPALASATRLIPDPVAGAANDDTVFVPGAAVAAANPANGSSKPTPKPPAVPAPVIATPAAATAAAAAAGAAAASAARAAPAGAVGGTQASPAVAAASARTPSASPRGDAGAPPRVQIGTDTAAAGPRREGPRAARPPETMLPPMDDDGGHRRLSGRLLPLLIGGIAVAVIIVGLVVITNTGGSTTANVSHGSGSDQTGESVSDQQRKPVPFKASKYTVAVLNGTAVAGLAGDVSTKLAGDGFKKGNATNAASQTYGSTIVYYVPGKNAAANKLAAVHVAKTLTLPDSRVRTATQKSIKSCSISASGASLGSCDGDVIVLVGSDRAGLASGGSGG